MLHPHELTEEELEASLLDLESRRLERAIRVARRERDFKRQHELAEARQALRREMDAVMGQAT